MLVNYYCAWSTYIHGKQRNRRLSHNHWCHQCTGPVWSFGSTQSCQFLPMISQHLTRLWLYMGCWLLRGFLVDVIKWENDSEGFSCRDTLWSIWDAYHVYLGAMSPFFIVPRTAIFTIWNTRYYDRGLETLMPFQRFQTLGPRYSVLSIVDGCNIPNKPVTQNHIWPPGYPCWWITWLHDQYWLSSIPIATNHTSFKSVKRCSSEWMARHSWCNALFPHRNAPLPVQSSILSQKLSGTKAHQNLYP